MSRESMSETPLAETEELARLRALVAFYEHERECWAADVGGVECEECDRLRNVIPNINANGRAMTDTKLPDYAQACHAWDSQVKELSQRIAELEADRDSWRNLYNLEVQHNEDMFESEEAVSQTIAELKAAGADEVVVLMPHTEPRGFLEVGTDANGMVIVNLDMDRTGHIVFSPEQARGFAASLIGKATDAEAEGNHD